ncbi:MAG: DUF169 domain-containing protein [Clostridiales bacterium]|nr:DUF169 domain-containing protein [Clostridiales bacterium]
MSGICRSDFSPLSDLDLEAPPVGIKFSFFRPENISPLEAEAELSLCEILRKSQLENRAFYFSDENKETCIGKIVLGMESFSTFETSGQIGERLGVFEDARANQNLYQFIPKLDPGVSNYVLFSPADKLTFEPDVLIVSARPAVAEIVMRAVTYSTGEMYKSCCTPVMGCAWFLVYPYKKGEVNFVIPAFVHGPHGRELWPTDTVLISIPYRWIPTVLTNLSRMTHHLPSHEGKQQYYEEFGGILKDLSEKAKNP